MVNKRVSLLVVILAAAALAAVVILGYAAALYLSTAVGRLDPLYRTALTAAFAVGLAVVGGVVVGRLVLPHVRRWAMAHWHDINKAMVLIVGGDIQRAVEVELEKKDLPLSPDARARLRWGTGALYGTPKSKAPRLVSQRGDRPLVYTRLVVKEADVSLADARRARAQDRALLKKRWSSLRSLPVELSAGVTVVGYRANQRRGFTSITFAEACGGPVLDTVRTPFLFTVLDGIWVKEDEQVPDDDVLGGSYIPSQNPSQNSERLVSGRFPAIPLDGRPHTWDGAAPPERGIVIQRDGSGRAAAGTKLEALANLLEMHARGYALFAVNADQGDGRAYIDRELTNWLTILSLTNSRCGQNEPELKVLPAQVPPFYGTLSRVYEVGWVNDISTYGRWREGGLEWLAPVSDEDRPEVALVVGVGPEEILEQAFGVLSEVLTPKSIFKVTSPDYAMDTALVGVLRKITRENLSFILPGLTATEGFRRYASNLNNSNPKIVRKEVTHEPPHH
jgi:hypothetical protein